MDVVFDNISEFPLLFWAIYFVVLKCAGWIATRLKQFGIQLSIFRLQGTSNI